MPSFFLRSSVRSAISSKFMLHISSTSRCTLGLPTSRSCSGSLSRGSGAAAYHLQRHQLLGITQAKFQSCDRVSCVLYSQASPFGAVFGAHCSGQRRFYWNVHLTPKHGLECVQCTEGNDGSTRKGTTAPLERGRVRRRIADIVRYCNPPVVCSRSQITPDCETTMGAQTWPVLTNAIGRSARKAVMPIAGAF